MRRLLVLLALTVSCATPAPVPVAPTTVVEATDNNPGAVVPVVPLKLPETFAKYATPAVTIRGAAASDDTGWGYLTELCDDIGPRLSGSPALDTALTWSADRLKAAGHENVAIEPVMVPHWDRGEESVRMTAPYGYPMQMLGLGRSVATPAAGLEADVVVVRTKEELDAADVKGKIVLFNAVMPPYDEADNNPHYGDVVGYRVRGPIWAAEKGAVAMLMRSVTANSLHTPHTGTTSYKDGVPKIPAAAIATEDADLIARLTARGKTVRVQLKMEAKTLPDAKSGNVVAEFRGSELPDEVIIIGGHIDSWDVGQGAHDNGAGVVISMAALDLLRRLELQPRRTIRVVLWTNEENGLAGAKAYAKEHANEKIIAAFESDSGGAKVIGFGVHVADPARQKAVTAKLTALAPIFEPMGVRLVKEGFAGADVGPLVRNGVIGIGITHDVSTYFDIHHTAADTLDKVHPADIQQGVAVMATLAYIMADMNETW